MPCLKLLYIKLKELGRLGLKVFCRRTQPIFYFAELVGETPWLRPPPWPGTIVSSCMSNCMTGDPGTENRANKPPPTGQAQERSKGDAMCPATSQNPSCWHSSWLSNTCTTRKDPESEWLARDNLETNPITIKPRLRVTWHSSPPGFPYPPALCPGTPFPVKSLALSACGLPRWC